MNETPVFSVEETPIRIPSIIREDAFFFAPINEDFLYGDEDTLKIPNFDAEHAIRMRLTIVVMLCVLLLLLLFHIPSAFGLGLVVIVVACAPLGFFYTLVWPKRANHKLNKRFYTEGQILEGTILSSRGKTIGRSIQHFVEAECRFQTPQGEMKQRRFHAIRNDLRGKHLPYPGTPVYVLYFNEDEQYVL